MNIFTNCKIFRTLSPKLLFERAPLSFKNVLDIRTGRGVKANQAKAAQYARTAADYGSLSAYKTVEKIPDRNSRL